MTIWILSTAFDMNNKPRNSRGENISMVSFIDEVSIIKLKNASHKVSLSNEP